MVSGLIEEIIKSKADPCAKCSNKWMMANSLLCTKCGKCFEMKRVSSTIAKDCACKSCVAAMKGIAKPVEELHFMTRWS